VKLLSTSQIFNSIFAKNIAKFKAACNHSKRFYVVSSGEKDVKCHFVFQPCLEGTTVV